VKTSALVITLRRSIARADQVCRIIDRCPVPCKIWDASDGTQLSVEQIAEVYQPRLHAPHYPFKLRPGEIGCFLSHRRIWQKMVDESIPHLLILEDDIEMLPNFNECLDHAIRSIPQDAYVQFQVRCLPSVHGLWSNDSETRLIKPIIVPLRTSAQLVTLGAARRLLHFSEMFDRPVDAAIQLTWLHGANLLVSSPQSVTEVSSTIGGSTIGSSKKKRPIMERIRREIDRTLYRHRIASQSKKYAA
jgi:glycosyl transferase family 25